ncbi:hypothetical protein BH09BAC5_BH09BAC5_03060 [soil metagenome]
MGESISKRPVVVGTFILVGLLFLVGGILTIGNLHSTFEKKMTVSTIFEDVNGLMPGNNIWFSGVKIGTVKRMDFYGKSQVRVVMNIDVNSKQYIRKDAKVKISTDGLIGNKILVIYGGTSTVEQVEEGDTLTNLKMLSTEDIMETFQQNNLNILAITKKLADGQGTIGRLMNSDSIYNNIAATTRSLQLASANAQVLIASLSTFSSKLNKEGTLANDLVSDTTIFKSIQVSVAELQKISDSAGVFVNTLKEASVNPNTPVGILMHDEQSGANIKTSISNINTLTATLNKDIATLENNIIFRRALKKQVKKAGK